jgi:hypothetical protein
MGCSVEHAIENVSIVNFQVPSELQAHGLGDGGFIANYGKLSARYIDENGPVANHFSIKGQLAKGTAFQNEADPVLHISLIIRQSGEVSRAQRIHFIEHNGSRNEIGFEIEDPIEIVGLLQVNAVVVP